MGRGEDGVVVPIFRALIGNVAESGVCLRCLGFA